MKQLLLLLSVLAISCTSKPEAEMANTFGHEEAYVKHSGSFTIVNDSIATRRYGVTTIVYKKGKSVGGETRYYICK